MHRAAGMLRQTRRLATALLLASACSVPSGGSGPVDDSARSDEANEANVTREAVDEPLVSEALRETLCLSTKALFQSPCASLEMTVTEMARSNLYAHAVDAAAVTMQMRVRVSDPSTGVSAETTLTRTVQPDLSLGFVAAVMSSSLDDLHPLILDIAERAGETPDWGAAEWEGVAEATSFPELPLEIANIMRAQLLSRRASLAEIEPASTSNLADPGLLILRGSDGQTIGYVLSLEDYIEHPLFDGSGANYFYDPAANLVTSSSWNG